jgi:dTDP-glucose 4,6-dehydratase
MAAPRFLVIGSNSFSGASFVAHVLSTGADVRGISRSPEPRDVYLPYTWQPHGRFQFFQHDLNHDLDGVMRRIEEFQPEYIVNFAAQGMVAQSWERPLDWYMTNTIAMVALHHRLRSCKFLRKFVQASTPEVYGSTSGVVKEDAPFNPSTPYAVSKAACDMNLLAYHRAYGFPAAFTRSANVCGPGQALYRIIPRTVLCVMAGEKLKLQGGGRSVRSFIHVRDVAEGTLRVAAAGTPGGIYHLSTDERISILDLVKAICAEMNAEFDRTVEVVEGRLGQDAAYLLDTAKARNDLGWTPQVTVREIIRDTIAWMRKYWDVIKNEPRDYTHKI